MPSPEDSATLKGYYEAVDNARVVAEREWGCGRLEIIAAPTLLARFRRQQATWREALQAAWEMDPVSGDAMALVGQKTQSMVRAWEALELNAAEAGHRHIAPWVWEARLNDGTVAAFVQTTAEASCVIAEGRYLKVYTLAEVAHLIDCVPEAFSPPRQIIEGRKFPTVSAIATGDEIPWDDPIPFGQVAT